MRVLLCGLHYTRSARTSSLLNKEMQLFDDRHDSQASKMEKRWRRGLNGKLDEGVCTNATKKILLNIINLMISIRAANYRKHIRSR
jgi:hypothetical protein